jgi:hypothetical protein
VSSPAVAAHSGTSSPAMRPSRSSSVRAAQYSLASRQYSWAPPPPGLAVPRPEAPPSGPPPSPAACPGSGAAGGSSPSRQSTFCRRSPPPPLSDSGLGSPSPSPSAPDSSRLWPSGVPTAVLAMLGLRLGTGRRAAESHSNGGGEEAAAGVPGAASLARPRLRKTGRQGAVYVCVWGCVCVCVWGGGGVILHVIN